MAVDWNSIYADELARIEDPTAKLEGLKQADIGALNTARAAQEQGLGKTRDETLRQAYITREMNKKDLPSIMANMGLTGGITETAANDLLRDYRNTSNSARRSYDTSATDLANTYGTNVANVNSSYGQRLLEALQNRQNTATNSANIRAQIAQAEEQAAEAKRQYDERQRLAQDQWEWQKAQAEAAAAAASQPTQIVATGSPSAPTAPEKTDDNNIIAPSNTRYNYIPTVTQAASNYRSPATQQQKTKLAADSIRKTVPKTVKNIYGWQ